MVVRTGDVSDQMDKSIGRPIIKIKGNVSANNFIEFSSLALTGSRSFLFLITESVLNHHSNIPQKCTDIVKICNRSAPACVCQT